MYLGVSRKARECVGAWATPGLQQTQNLKDICAPNPQLSRVVCLRLHQRSRALLQKYYQPPEKVRVECEVYQIISSLGKFVLNIHLGYECEYRRRGEPFDWSKWYGEWRSLSFNLWKGNSTPVSQQNCGTRHLLTLWVGHKYTSCFFVVYKDLCDGSGGSKIWVKNCHELEIQTKTRVALICNRKSACVCFYSGRLFPVRRNVVSRKVVM